MAREDEKIRESRKWLSKVVAQSRLSYLSAVRLLEIYTDKLTNALKDGESTDNIISSLQNDIYNLLEEEMTYSVQVAAEKEGDDSRLWMFLIPMFVSDTDRHLNISGASERYATILSQEVSFFRDSGYEPKLLSDFLKNPLGFEASRNNNVVLLKNTVTEVSSGVSYDMTKTLSPVTLNTAVKTYALAVQQMWQKKGIKYYKGYRNSTYDCPLCDELCSKVWPITNMVFPAHPRCVCGIIEIEL